MASIDELKEEHATGGTPCSVTDPSGKPIEYTFFRPQQYGEKYIIKEWPSFNAMLEGYYAEKMCIRDRFYGMIFLLAAFVPKEFLAVAFDSGGVTTGPMTCLLYTSFLGAGPAVILLA